MPSKYPHEWRADGYCVRCTHRIHDVGQESNCIIVMLVHIRELEMTLPQAEAVIEAARAVIAGFGADDAETAALKLALAAYDAGEGCARPIP